MTTPTGSVITPLEEALQVGGLTKRGQVALDSQWLYI